MGTVFHWYFFQQPSTLQVSKLDQSMVPWQDDSIDGSWRTSTWPEEYSEVEEPRNRGLITMRPLARNTHSLRRDRHKARNGFMVGCTNWCIRQLLGGIAYTIFYILLSVDRKFDRNAENHSRTIANIDQHETAWKATGRTTKNTQERSSSYPPLIPQNDHALKYKAREPDATLHWFYWQSYVYPL